MEEYQIRLESERRIIQAAYKNYEESILQNPPTSISDTFNAQKRRTHFSNLPPEFQPKATSPEQSDPLLDEQENTGLADMNPMDQEGFIDMDDSNS